MLFVTVWGCETHTECDGGPFDLTMDYILSLGGSYMKGFTAVGFKSTPIWPDSLEH